MKIQTILLVINRTFAEDTTNSFSDMYSSLYLRGNDFRGEFVLSINVCRKNYAGQGENI